MSNREFVQDLAIIRVALKVSPPAAPKGYIDGLLRKSVSAVTPSPTTSVLADIAELAIHESYAGGDETACLEAAAAIDQLEKRLRYETSFLRRLF